MADEIKVPTPRDLGILVSIHISGPGGIHKEKEVTREVAEQKNVKDKNILNVTSKMFHKEYTDPWLKGARDLVSYSNEINPPFGNDGKRFLANGLIDSFQAEVEKRNIELDQLREKFMLSLPEQKKIWIDNGGDISSQSVRSFPTREDMEDKLRVEVDYVQCSSVEDVRLGGLSGEQRKRYENEVKESHNKKIKQVVKHIASSIESKVGLVLKKMDKPENGGFKPKEGKGTKQENGFHSSLIENCKELAGFLEHWNITKDAEIDAVRRRLLTDIATLDPSELKKDHGLREKAHKTAEDILSRVVRFGGDKD